MNCPTCEKANGYASIMESVSPQVSYCVECGTIVRHGIPRRVIVPRWSAYQAEEMRLGLGIVEVDSNEGGE